MATFKLSDKFGFSTDVEAGPGALSRYFKSLPDFVNLAINLRTFVETTWDDPSVIASHNTFSFGSPVDIGSQAVSLRVSADLNGELGIFVPATDGDPLFKPDEFGDNIPVPMDTRYVSATIQAALAPGASTALGELQFGFNGESEVKLSYYHPFCLNSDTGTPPVLESIKRTLAAFTIPGDLKDIEAMTEGSIATVHSTGELKFSGTVNLLTVTNPLASANLPVVGDLKVSAGGSIEVGAGFKFGGSYQVRVQKLPGTRFRLGFYRERERGFSVNASASASISTPLDTSPLLKNLLPAISAQPAVDENEFLAAGLSASRIAAIESALKSAVDRTLSIGAQVELTDSTEHDAMFLYEVDLGEITPDGRAMLQRAMKGDLTDLVARDHNPGPGIQILKTLVESSKTLKHVLKVNLLGIYNVISISKLLTSGDTAWDSTTGEFVITDSVNASRIDIDGRNFGANPDKLRNVLSESLLMSAAYRAGEFVSGPPTCKACHTYCTESTTTDLGRMKHNLLLGEGLGFTDAGKAKAALLAQERDFGRTLLLAEASYDDAAFTSLFFDGARQRDLAEYDRAGRNALQYLVQPGDSNDYRLRIVKNDQLWASMRKVGNTQSTEFKQLFPDLPASAVQFIGVDYINIVWWADAMHKAGDHLLQMRQFLALPNVGRDDPRFRKLKQDLADHLAQVAKLTKQDFGGPWGLFAMRLAAANAGRRFIVVNPTIPLACEVPLPPSAIGAGKP